MSDELLKAAINAQNTISAVYAWVDRVEKAGGATSISGIAECHAMLKSLKSQRARLDKLITEPLDAAIKAAREAAQ